MKKRYNPRTFPCPYKCNTYCHSASGLTQHSTACYRNPANRRASSSTFPLNPTIWPPQTPPATGTGPPLTPSTPPTPQDPDHPSPLILRPATPTPASPRRTHWITNSRGVKTRVHPYLNGLILLQTKVVKSLIYLVQGSLVTQMVMSYLETPRHPPRICVQTPISSPTHRALSLS